MKKITFLPALLLCFAIASSAQNTESPDTPSQSKHQMDCCMMHKGKMMYCMMMGKMEPMEKDMMMKDSTIVKTDGTVIKKNGEKMKMKEGMCCDMMGNMHQSCERHKEMMKGKQKAEYACPMHPEETSDKQGKCPKCGMMMKKQE
ncbi:MAG TPA: DUF6799 domain-containing protein [Chitinophagales bacterium]|nr:DUF6799 domain-containing protein [Chitinophagales bacterium]